jgi:protein-disulfide isomerase
VLAEFADYECPFCARHAALVAEELHRKYVASGQIKHVFINLPLPAHPNARRLATAVLCAGIQKRYWEMHKAVFQVKPKTDNGIFELAQALGLHVNDFSACLNNTRENQELIERDLRIAKSFELTATPSFAIGSITSSGQMAVKKLVTGAQPLKVFETEIDRLLSEER